MAFTMKAAITPCALLPARKTRANRINSRKALTVKAVDPASALKSVGEIAAAGGSMYVIMSYNEYLTHRYYQHNEVQKLQLWQDIKNKFPQTPKLDGGGHVEHHAETLDDMLLRDDDRWKASVPCKRLDESGDPWRGTAFAWDVTGLMTIQMVPSVYPWFMGVMHWSFLDTTGLFLPSMILHALVWNALHPNMHGLPDVPMSVGAPSWVLAPFRDSAYFKWLHENHAGHHVSGGTTNYNVACPLVDHLIGTYETAEKWMGDLEAKEARKAQAELAKMANASIEATLSAELAGKPNVVASESA